MTERSPEDIARWQRYFAVESNNLAWNLATRPRQPAEDAQMLDAAHAASFHWQLLGPEQNRQRAQLLLAEVHALLGMGASALAYAEPVHAYLLAQPETPDWEMALSFGVLAHAAHAAGEQARYESAYAEALRAVDGIRDPEDRAIVMETFSQVPAPGQSPDSQAMAE